MVLSIGPHRFGWENHVDFSIEMGNWVFIISDVGRFLIDKSRDQHISCAHFDVARYKAAGLAGINVDHES